MHVLGRGTSRRECGGAAEHGAIVSALPRTYAREVCAQALMVWLMSRASQRRRAAGPGLRAPRATWLRHRFRSSQVRSVPDASYPSRKR
jgi:hypothetical protein